MYIWEAHDGEGKWTNFPEFKDIAEPKNLQERIAVYELYKKAESVTVPALIDDPGVVGGNNPGIWSHSSYDSQPTSIYLIGKDSTFQFLVNFALMGWSDSYDMVDKKIEELLADVSTTKKGMTKTAKSGFSLMLDGNILRIDSETDKGVGFTMFSINGRTVTKSKLSDGQGTFNCQSLNRGVYFVTVEYANGVKETQRIMVK